MARITTTIVFYPTAADGLGDNVEYDTGTFHVGVDNVDMIDSDVPIIK